MGLKEALEENKALKAKVEDLEVRLDQLLKLFSNSKSERFVPKVAPEQISLFNQYKKENLPEEQKEEVTYTRSKSKKKHLGRNPLPENIPTREVIHEPKEDTTDKVKIGEDIVETLEYTPASLVKVINIFPKYADKDGSNIIIANRPDRPIPKGIPEASLLTHIFVQKFVDHLPFYRQCKIFKRDYNWELPSSTINDWFVACCTLLKPLYDHMEKELLNSKYLQADESPIKVLAEDKPKSTHRGYQWVYRCANSGIVIFKYRKGRGQNGPKEMLENFEGYLQTDGYSVYDSVAKVINISLVGCWAHARRKFFEAKNSNKEPAEYALSIIRKIYAHEREAKDLEAEKRKAYRLEHTKPLFEELKEWAKEKYQTAIPKSPIGKALGYLLNQWEKLERVLEDGHLEIDNNLIENKIRPLALGRKNYLFAGSHPAAQRIAMMYSFFATCAAKDVNPYDWMKDTLEKLPSTKLSELGALVPGAEG